jgi:predicted alpha/beta-hydrolase family hydrolase
MLGWMPRESRFEQGGVRGFLDRPARAPVDGLVLTHGAGGDCRMPLVVAVADAFVGRGLAVLRVDLPFRQKRPHGAPSPSDAARDRGGLRAAVAALRGMVPGRVFLGGQSYGGRQASMLAAEDPGLAAALLLLSYPLHPPAKPERLRTEHFPALKTPALFVHGARDPFATEAELRAALALIPARTELVELARAGHELARGRFDVDTLVAAPLLRL